MLISLRAAQHACREIWIDRIQIFKIVIAPNHQLQHRTLL